MEKNPTLVRRAEGKARDVNVIMKRMHKFASMRQHARDAAALVHPREIQHEERPQTPRPERAMTSTRNHIPLDEHAPVPTEGQWDWEIVEAPVPFSNTQTSPTSRFVLFGLVRKRVSSWFIGDGAAALGVGVAKGGAEGASRDESSEISNRALATVSEPSTGEEGGGKISLH